MYINVLINKKYKLSSTGTKVGFSNSLASNSIAHLSSFIAQDTSNKYSISSIEKVVKYVLDKNKRKCNVNKL